MLKNKKILFSIALASMLAITTNIFADETELVIPITKTTSGTTDNEPANEENVVVEETESPAETTTEIITETITETTSTQQEINTEPIIEEIVQQEVQTNTNTVITQEPTSSVVEVTNPIITSQNVYAPSYNNTGDFWVDEVDNTNIPSTIIPDNSVITYDIDSVISSATKKEIEWGVIRTDDVINDTTISDSSKINFSNIITDIEPIIQTLSSQKVEYVPATLEPLVTLTEVGITPLEMKEFDTTHIIIGIATGLILIVFGHVKYYNYLKQLKRKRKEDLEKDILKSIEDIEKEVEDY